MKLPATPVLASLVVAGAIIIGSIGFGLTSTNAATYNNCAQDVKPTLRQGDRGECVRLAQQLLAQHGTFNDDGFTTYFGIVTDAATRDFQRNAGITVDGIIGPITWSKLLEGTQTRQIQLVSRQSQSTTVPSKCLTSTAKTICIDKHGGSKATLYALDNKQIMEQMPVRTGDARGAKYATTVGAFSVGRMYEDYQSREFDGADMPYSMFFNGGQAIHYSEDFAQNGYNGGGASHGCVNIGDREKARWLFEWSEIYTRVIVTS